MTVAMTPPMKSPALVSISAAIPLDLNSCRRDIERAAQMKMTPTTSSLTIRECLLSVGLSPCQASNRTMQARVRREVKHLINGSTRKIPWGEKSRPPCEITIRTFVTAAAATATPVTVDGTTTMMMSIIKNNNHNNDDFDSHVNELFQEVDDISLLSEPTCFLQLPLPQPQQQQQQQKQQAPTPPPQRVVTATSTTMSPYPNPTTVSTSAMLVEPQFAYVHPGATGVAAMAAAAAAAATTMAVSVNPLLFPQQYQNLYHPHSQQQQMQQLHQQQQQASRNDRNHDSTTATINNINHPHHHQSTNTRPIDFTLDAVNKWLEAEAMV